VSARWVCAHGGADFYVSLEARLSRLCEPAEPHRVSSRLPYPTNPSGDGETSGVPIINMAPDICTELPTVSSSTDAARPTPPLVCNPPGSRTANIDDRHVGDSDEYAGVEWSRLSLRGYTRSKSSALKTNWIWDYGWRIDNKDGK
jgi:hypothetical protein